MKDEDPLRIGQISETGNWVVYYRLSHSIFKCFNKSMFYEGKFRIQTQEEGTGGGCGNIFPIKVETKKNWGLNLVY